MAVDETCLKSRGERLWVWAAVDPETGEAIRLEAPWHRSAQALRSLRKALELFRGRPTVLVDHGPRVPLGPEGPSYTL
jgi:transposase-like protein